MSKSKTFKEVPTSDHLLEQGPQPSQPSLDQERFPIHAPATTPKINKVFKLVQELDNIQEMCKLAERSDLYIVSRGTGQSIMQHCPNIEVREELQDLIYAKSNERMADITEELSELGVEIDIDNVMDIPEFVLSKE